MELKETPGKDGEAPEKRGEPIYSIWVGIVFTAISIFITLFCFDNALGTFLIKTLIKKSGVIDEQQAIGRKILLSAGLIGLALKIATVYGGFILFGFTVVIYFVIIFAFGLLFEGKARDFENAAVWARIIGKVCNFIYSWMDPIINFIIRKEFEKLNIKTI